MLPKIFRTKKEVVTEIAFYLGTNYRGIENLERVDYPTLVNILTRLEWRDKHDRSR